jgi:putative hemolysin
MDKKTKITILILLIILAIIIGLVSINMSLNTLPQTGDEQDLTIFDFDSCVSAGYPVLESYPAQCKTPDGRTFTQEDSQIANPASEFCIENGGRLEIRQDLQGEAGFCIFEDGSECEEWAYFNGECEAPL